MKRSGPIARKTPLRRSSKPMPFMREAKRAQRAIFHELVMKKNGGMCQVCTDLQKTLPRFKPRKADHPHHILPKGRGGSDHPDNGIPVCFEHHKSIHADPLLAEVAGYLKRASKA